MTESQIQKACLDLLLSLEEKGFPIWATRANAGKAKSFRGYAIQLCRAGTPDILACVNRKFVGFEIKKGEEGKQSPAQRETEESLKWAGGEYIVIRSISDMRKYLKDKGFLFEGRKA